MKRRFFAFLLIACLLAPVSTGFADRPIGDVNDDGAVHSSDAAYLLRSVVGLDVLSMADRRYADLNEDGLVTATDAAIILRSVVGLDGTTVPTPSPTSTVPAETPTPTPPAQNEWYDEVCTGLGSSADPITANAIANFLTALDEDDPYREVLLAALVYMGVDYDTLDCSAFVKQAFRDCGYGSSVITGNSNGMLQFFREKGLLKEAKDDDGEIRYGAFRPGSILIYTDSNGTGNHVALYIGKVNGSYWLMDSSTSRDAVCIRTVWDWGNWNLVYFADAL